MLKHLSVEKQIQDTLLSQVALFPGKQLLQCLAEKDWELAAITLWERADKRLFPRARCGSREAIIVVQGWPWETLSEI
jgi:hypothetical protein